MRRVVTSCRETATRSSYAAVGHPGDAPLHTALHLSIHSSYLFVQSTYVISLALNTYLLLGTFMA